MNRIILRIGCFFVLLAAAFPPVLIPGLLGYPARPSHGFILDSNDILLGQYIVQILVTVGLTFLAAWVFGVRKPASQNQTQPPVS